LFACAVATVVALPLVSAHAGTGGTEFDTFYDTIVDWAQGSLGKALALSMFLVGIGMGVVRGSVIAAVPAIGGALGLFIAPTIIDAIVTATLSPAAGSLVLPAVELALDQL
jgi:conjugal transfer pilus assembly protein TraA